LGYGTKLAEKPKRVRFMREMPQLGKAVREWLRAIGREGGKSKSEAKVKASVENGKLGGRPRKKRLTAKGE
jgi:hypothetical protein